MKKLIPALLFAMFALNSNTILADNSSSTENEPLPTPSPKTENKLSETEVARLSARFEEINKMDKKGLTASEKGELRKESSQIKEELKADGNVVYISSAAAVILIVIILILIL